ncbi:MAG: ATP-binding protein [Methanobrevibacter sp.]|jgi:anti-sigma regulatory factor (Ser/Thr protein kinase)|nr:ATP-binding protein [Methanobrevibacter sp.]
MPKADIKESGEIVVSSQKNELKRIFDLIHNSLKPYHPSNDFKLKLNLVIEEIFINIVKHGYKESKQNKVKISYLISENPLAINIRFIDNGILFNPLKYMNDLDLYMDNIDYEKSGLGIIIIKNNVDEVSYKTKNNQNILSFKKIIKD